jgi:hypothetical protein
VSHVPPRALIVLRVPRGAAPPAEEDIRAAIENDRVRLALPADDVTAYRVAGPYAIEVDGRSLDEYVAWEI